MFSLSTETTLICHFSESLCFRIIAKMILIRAQLIFGETQNILQKSQYLTVLALQQQSS